MQKSTVLKYIKGKLGEEDNRDKVLEIVKELFKESGWRSLNPLNYVTFALEDQGYEVTTKTCNVIDDVFAFLDIEENEVMYVVGKNEDGNIEFTVSIGEYFNNNVDLVKLLDEVRSSNNLGAFRNLDDVELTDIIDSVYTTFVNGIIGNVEQASRVLVGGYEVKLEEENSFDFDVYVGYLKKGE